MPPAKRRKVSPPKTGLSQPSFQPASTLDISSSDHAKENKDPAQQTIKEASVDQNFHTPVKASRAGINPGSNEAIANEDEDEDEDGEYPDAPDTISTTATVTTPSKTSPLFSTPSKSYAGGYDALKSFNGQVYKGMAVGGSHTWNYDPGVWRETKLEPDLWKIDYETTKRRAKNAPKGSGAPVGTEYHWLIVAHQYVTKVDANTYETHLSGSKYKLAHKNATATSWSIPTVKVQREREIELLDDARRRLQGLPPVLASEKVKREKKEKGQVKLDSLFSKAGAGAGAIVAGGSPLRGSGAGGGGCGGGGGGGGGGNNGNGNEDVGQKRKRDFFGQGQAEEGGDEA